MNATENAPHYFATKYDSARDEIIGQMAFEPNAWTGDVEAPCGYVALVVLAGTAEEIASDDYAQELATTYDVSAAEIAGAWLVKSDDRGFVYVKSFDSEKDAREAFECTDARYAVWADEERDEDDTTYVCPVQGHGYHEL